MSASSALVQSTIKVVNGGEEGKYYKYIKQTKLAKAGTARSQKVNLKMGRLVHGGEINRWAFFPSLPLDHLLVPTNVEHDTVAQIRLGRVLCVP